MEKIMRITSGGAKKSLYRFSKRNRNCSDGLATR